MAKKKKIKCISQPIQLQSEEMGRKDAILKYAEEARDLSYAQMEASANRMNVGAVLLDSNFTKISSGVNEMNVSHPRLLKFYDFPFIHAESAAVIASRKQLKNAVMIIVRTSKDGTLSHSKPCLFCQNFMYHSGVKKAYFINEEGKLDQMKLSALDLKLSSQKSLENLNLCCTAKSA